MSDMAADPTGDGSTGTGPSTPPAPSTAAAPELPPRVLAPPDAQVPYTLRVLGGWAWRIVVIAAALWVIGLVASTLTFVFVALFVGAVIAALVNPLVNLVDRILPRGIAVAISLLVSAIAVLGVLAFIVVAFINQLPELIDQIVTLFDSIREWLRTGPLHVDATQLDTWLSGAQDWLRANAATLATQVIGGLGTVGELVAGLALAVFGAIFFLYDGKGIWGWLVGLTPRRAQVRIRTSGVLAWRTFSAYARGTVLIALSNAILVGIGLVLLRVPIPIPLALLVFFGTFIPYVGAPVAMLVAALVGLAANGPLTLVLVIVMITIIGQIEGNVLQPLIMSKQVALHPLAVIVSVAVGSVAAGIVGAIVAVPVVSVLWVVVRYLGGRDPENPRPPPFSGDPGVRVAGDG